MNKSAGIHLCGGLGNRLFQIAFIYSYGKKYNKKVGYYSVEHNPHSQLDYFEKVFPFLERIDLKNFITYVEPNDQCISFHEVENFEKDCLFMGYFQSEKYFQDHREDILSIFKFPKSEIKNKSIFIHIRRGDYISSLNVNAVHYLQLDNYFKKALEYLLSLKPVTNIYIFSDDIEYCKKEKMFQEFNIPIDYITNMNEIETLSFMTECEYGGICSNSTFSWWAGYLNNSQEKIIIFPYPWFANPKHKKYPNQIYFRNSYVMDLQSYQIKKIV
jgi:hypothetical protein